MNFLELTTDKLDLNGISELVNHGSCGAISVFIGTTRDNFEDKKVSMFDGFMHSDAHSVHSLVEQVLQLEYEAYDAMALKSMARICDAIRQKWSEIKNIAIYHRLGVVPVKEASIIIAISSAHRQDSLEAVSFAIDEVKRTVPIWKKEIYGGSNEGTSAWKENKECAWSQ